MIVLAAIVLGLGIGFATGWLARRPDGTQGRVETAVLQEQLAAARAGAEAATRAAEQARCDGEEKAEALRQDIENAAVAAAKAQAELAGEREKLGWLASAQEQLREAFKALAADSLRENAKAVFEGARAQVVAPLAEQLGKLDGAVRAMEEKRAGAYSELSVQVTSLATASADVQREANTLSTALRSSATRGRWGELQLKRLLELAGMTAHVAFTEQVAVGDARPDVVVSLPSGGSLPVDAKAPMEQYFLAVEATTEQARRAAIVGHAEAVFRKVKELGDKAYWKQFEPAPEFVVMYVPVESALSAACEARPTLLEEAIERKVLLASPVTLLAVLKAVAYGWQQQDVAAGMKAIEAECRELYTRLMKFAGAFAGVGGKIEGAVEAWNAAVGSYQSRLLPATRRMAVLGTDVPAEPGTIDVPARRVEVAGGN